MCLYLVVKYHMRIQTSKVSTFPPLPFLTSVVTSYSNICQSCHLKHHQFANHDADTTRTNSMVVPATYNTDHEIIKTTFIYHLHDAN
jgi:hypothetical protein